MKQRKSLRKDDETEEETEDESEEIFEIETEEESDEEPSLDEKIVFLKNDIENILEEAKSIPVIYFSLINYKYYFYFFTKNGFIIISIYLLFK